MGFNSAFKGLNNHKSDMFQFSFMKPSSVCDLKRFLVYNQQRLRKYEISFLWSLQYIRK